MPTLLLSALLMMAGAAEPAGAAAPADCAASPAALPAELAGWATPAALTAAAGADASAATLTIGQAADLALHPTPHVAYPVAPARPGDAASYGGVAQFSVAKAGIYRVALDTGAWVDIVTEGRSLESQAHGHGPACSGIHKMVDFQLEPGRYLLDIVGSASPSARVLVAQLPAG